MGTSGFNYAHWQDVFYPPGMPPERFLAFYARHFPVVELNVTFHRLVPRAVFQRWADATPRSFRFAIKGSRHITHILRLKKARHAVLALLRHARPLEDRLETILWQLPPQFPFDPHSLETFLKTIHAPTMPDGLRHAFEFRHPSWFNPDTYAALRRHGDAIVYADAPLVVAPRGTTLRPSAIHPPATADWVYVRRQGPHGAASGYSPEAIQEDAAWLLSQRSGYVFYNNDLEAHAVFDAQALMARLEAGASLQRRRPTRRRR